MTSLLFVGLFMILMGVSIFFTNRAFKKGKNIKKLILVHVLSFVFILVASLVPAVCASAQENTSNNTKVVAEQQTTEAKDDSSKGWGYLAMGLAIGLTCLGTGLAVSSAASAAIGATSEEPKLFSKYLIIVALAEGVSVFGFLVSIFIYGAINK